MAKPSNTRNGDANKLSVRREKGKIWSHIRKQWLVETPEETVRQEYLCTLVNEYGFTLDQMDEEAEVKESNKLEEVDAGLIHSADNVYITYPDPARDSWNRDVVPRLRMIPLSVQIRETGLSRRMLIRARKGQVRPHSRNQRLLAMVVTELSA